MGTIILAFSPAEDGAEQALNSAASPPSASYAGKLMLGANAKTLLDRRIHI
jgi:hypothetical protein